MKDVNEFPTDLPVYPIPLRPDVVVKVHGIPPDMTRSEAEKVGRVVTALATNRLAGDVG